MQDESWGEPQIKKLAGLNFLRVFAKVEKVSHPSALPYFSSLYYLKIAARLDAVMRKRVNYIFEDFRMNLLVWKTDRILGLEFEIGSRAKFSPKMILEVVMQKNCNAAPRRRKEFICRRVKNPNRSTSFFNGALNGVCEYSLSLMFRIFQFSMRHQLTSTCGIIQFSSSVISFPRVQNS